MSTSLSQPARNALRGASMAFPASLVVLLVFLVPLLILVRYSFNVYDPVDLMRSALSWSNYHKFFADPYYRRIFLNTLGIAALCTVLALLLGLPVAYFLARTQSRFKSLYVILLVFPLMVGNVVRAAGWMIVFGNAGVLDSLARSVGMGPMHLLYTPTAVVVGTLAVVMPYMILTLQSVLEGVDFTLEEAAQILGAGTLIRLRRVLLPIIAPGIAAGTMLVFILCMNAYATPVLLGGAGITMMAPALYDQIAKASNWPFGAALALVLVLGTLLMATLSSWLIHRRYRQTMSD